ncbi:hypothetical protein Taro_008729 [Colocasia esculenta]|uniref:Uncharacterized protein n=1 Tax=Colocasia esculenta TaxID=4460 RepID=A0A843TUG8_COLES|nr:hypothetical protein [Colocasia esculenta]
MIPIADRHHIEVCKLILDEVMNRGLLVEENFARREGTRPRQVERLTPSDYKIFVNPFHVELVSVGLVSMDTKYLNMLMCFDV